MFKVMQSSHFGKKTTTVMDNYAGDLTDILRASTTTAVTTAEDQHRQFYTTTTNDDVSTPANINSSKSSSSSAMEDSFGDPYSDLNDPLLLHGLGVPNSVFFTGSGLVGAEGGVFAPGMVLGDSSSSIMNRQQPQNPNIYTRMLQMCGDHAPDTTNIATPGMIQEIKMNPVAAAGLMSNRGDVSIRVDKSKGCLVETTGTTMQISSPSNSGIKRRKSQAKKVVCIPAPATANSRSTGEVVPSDLWAWRKYGQKPIKGSPYPRGYYRCSSSKGCSARKQVERSRTDPNMLVITYTSEHNHPWPTQRNALAGSTRSQPSSKHNNTGAANSKTTPLSPQKSPSGFKEPTEADPLSPTTVNNAGASSTTSASVKEEVDDAEKNMEMDEFSEEFCHSYRPLKPEETALRGDDFFADLGEISGDDPLGLLFSQGFGADGQKEGKGLDPFSLFDWSIDDEPESGFGEAKRDK